MSFEVLQRADRRMRMRAKVHARRSTDVVAPRPPGSLLDFVPRVSPRFRAPTHLADLARAIERGVGGERVRACFSVPVRHGKTSLIQHAIPWILARDPTRSILYVSYSHGFAKKQTGKAREIAERWGVPLGSTKRRDEWTTRAGGQVKAAGIGGQITGEGFTDIFVDDPHKNRAEAESRIVREGVIEAFFSDIYTRLDPRGTSYYVVHARWNVNDLIGVLSRLDPYPFERHNAPALDAEGRALAPWLFDVAQLEELRETLGPYTWASLYQGEPRPRGGALFYEPAFVTQIATPESYRIAIGLDLATSTRSRADHNAAVVLRKDLAQGTIDILDAVRARGTIADRFRDSTIVDEGFARQVVRLLYLYPDANLYMFAADSELGTVQLFERMLADLLDRDVKITTFKITRDKFNRAQPYAADWNRGRVRMLGRKSVSIEVDGARVEAPHVDVVDAADRDGRNRHGWQSWLVPEHTEFTGVPGQEDDGVDAAVAAHAGLEDDGSTSLEEAMESAGRITW